MAAAVAAGAVPIFFERARAEAGDAAGDVAVGAAAISVRVPVQGGLHAIPKDDVLVPGGQHIGLADLRELNANSTRDSSVNEGGARGDVQGVDAGVMDDAHRGVRQGDASNLEGAVAIEEQPWRAVAGVTGEVQSRLVAVGGPEAEGVRHANVATGGVAVVGQRYGRWSHRRQWCIC